MSLTASTYVLVPIFCILAVMFRKDLLALAVASSIFQGASILDVKSTGIPIWIPLLAVSCVLDLKPQAGQKSKLLSRLNASSVIWITVFFAYSIISTFCMTFIFRGLLMPRGMAPRTSFGLELESMNVNQCLYLVLSAIVFYRCAIAPSLRFRENVINFYVNACAVAAVIGLYQVLSARYGWYLPINVLYSNSFHSQLFNDRMADLTRLNATFTEASVAALFLGGAFGVAIARCSLPQVRTRDVLLAILFALALILTLSTTAYLVLFLGLSYFAAKVAKQSVRSRRAVLIGVVSLFLIGGASVVLVANHTMGRVVDKVAAKVLTQKTDSASFNQRHTADVGALEVFRETLLLGAGLGSFRASSAFAELLADVGIIGTGSLLLCIVIALLKQIKTFKYSGHGAFVSLGFVLLFVAHSISVPELIMPAFWAFLGLMMRSINPPPVYSSLQAQASHFNFIRRGTGAPVTPQPSGVPEATIVPMGT